MLVVARPKDPLIDPTNDRRFGRLPALSDLIQHVSLYFMISPLALFTFTVNARAGENEVRALAKLFPGDLIVAQTIEDGFAPSDQQFMEAFTSRMMKAAETDPELSERMKKGPPPTPEERAAVMAKLGATEAEIAKLNALNADPHTPPTHLAGPLMKFRLVRADGAISFRLVDGSLPDVSDPYVKLANKLLSSLRLKIDGTGAEFRGQSLGPAEWIDNTSKYSGRRRSLQWLAHDVDAQNLTLEIDGQNREVSKIDATVFFQYNEKQKRLFVNMAIWPAGSNPTSGEYLRLAVGTRPATSAP